MKSIPRLTTTQQILIELQRKGVPLALILERGKLKPEQIEEAIKGNGSLEVYVPLISIACLMDVKKKECEKLETMILKLEMDNAFFGGTEYDNKPNLTNYADKHGG